MKKNSIIIGICGGSGSGKTSVLNGIQSHFAKLKPAAVSLDNYYLPIELQAKDENGKVNFDLPTALDRNQIRADLDQLLSGQSIEIPEYTFNHVASSRTIHIAPSKLILIEGLFVMHYREIAELLDISIYVDVCEKMQLERRIERDMIARGYSKEAIMYQWEQHVLPCYENYIEPYKKEATYVVMNDKSLHEMVEESIQLIESHPSMVSLLAKT